MGFHLFVRSTVQSHDEREWQSTSNREDAELCHDRHEDDEERASNIDCAATLKLNIPSYDLQAEKGVEESTDEGCRTPTSWDHKMPSSPPCPPAPKKPKSVATGKRKLRDTASFLDLSKEIESLFPAPLLLDLYGKIKKVRRGHGTPVTHE